MLELSFEPPIEPTEPRVVPVLDLKRKASIQVEWTHLPAEYGVWLRPGHCDVNI